MCPLIVEYRAIRTLCPFIKGKIMESKRKLLDIVRDKIRFKHYCISTESLQEN